MLLFEGLRGIGPAAFRRALLAVPPGERDAWADRLFDVRELPDDGAELPRGAVPYYPAPVDAVLETVDALRIGPDDVFVDVGAGIGRAAALVHLLTAADVVGVEIQSALVVVAQELAARLGAPRLRFLRADADDVVRLVPDVNALFLYCPFSGDRLARFVDCLEPLTWRRPIRLAALDVPLPDRRWLERAPARGSANLDVVVSRARGSGVPR